DANISLDRMAIFLGERYKNLATLIKSIRQHMQSGKTFSFNMSKKDPQEISDITQFCFFLHKEKLILTRKYVPQSKIMRISPSQDKVAIEFLNGGWFARFIQLKILSFLEYIDAVNHYFISNLQIILPDGNQFGFDMFFMVDNQPIFIKTKTGQYDESYIQRYAKFIDVLSISYDRAILVILEGEKNLIKSLSSRHRIVICNESDFIEKFQAALGAPQSSNRPIIQKISQIGQNSINNLTPQNIYSLLNREQLRPLPEFRLSVIKELINLVGTLERPKTMSEVKLILSEQSSISKSQLQDILNAIVRSSCLVDEKGEVIKQFVLPFISLVSSNPEDIETKCLEWYVRTILISNPNFFSDMQNVLEYERVVGAKAPASTSIELLKRQLNLS
ncbi:MAG: hypothetical protein MUD01_19620, partial [Chloroflexaceae bacterium]|nr:hypothetical protein [Chloroflexaceae bacterium]